MRLIVVGAGKVGTALVKQISKENVDIVVIDESEAAINAITDAFDCNGFVGNGSDPELLKKAGVEAASLLVALTKSDETNILCCSVGKRMGVNYTIAAVRGEEYEGSEEFFKKLGVDSFVNPHRQVALEVNKLIKYAGEIEIEYFGDGDVSVATVKIEEGSILADTALPEVQSKLGVHVLICAIDRGGKMITPKGKQVIKTGDTITLAAIGSDMGEALTKLGIFQQSLKRAAIVGGGRIGIYLAKQMIKEGIKVTIVEASEQRCAMLMNELPTASVVCGDGTDTELMEQLLKKTDACVVMSGKDEANLVISMFANSIGTERIATEIDNEDYDKMLRKSGIKHTFSTRDVSIGNIIHYARRLIAEADDKDNNVINGLYNFNHGKVEAVEFELTEEFPLLGIPFKSNGFKIKPGILIAIIVRNGVAIIPNGDSVLMENDRVIIVCAEKTVSKLTEIIG